MYVKSTKPIHVILYKGGENMESKEKISAVQRMQDYIEKHVTEQITLSMLAATAGYSPWHSARIFKELIGKAPFEYIRSFRLTKAAIKLSDKDVRIVDVALEFVFDSHEGFTRAFSKEFGVTPQNYRRNFQKLKLFMPSRIEDYYHKSKKGEDNMCKKSGSNTVFVQVIERPERKLILKRGINATHYFEYCEEVGCDVWDLLCGIKNALYEPIGMWLPENLRTPNTSLYAQGVEVPVNYSGEVPEGFEVIDLAPCKMMIFQGQPYDDEKFEEAIDELWETMKNYDPEIYGFKWAEEDSPRFQLAPMGYRGYIEGKPVRQLN